MLFFFTLSIKCEYLLPNYTSNYICITIIHYKFAIDLFNQLKFNT